MNKLFTTLLLTLVVTLTTYAQSLYYRAHLFTLGERINDKVEFNTTMETNVLLEFNSSDIKIYSESPQHYHTIGLLLEEEDTNVWMCKDDNGINCRIYLNTRPESSAIALTVEYNDYVWIYICDKE
jgi:hypothetical protein